MAEPTSMVWTTGNYTLRDDTSFVLIPNDNTTVTLSSASGKYGKQLIIKNIKAAKKTTIVTVQKQTIDGQPNYVMTKAWECLSLRSDGSNWLIMS